ncbi:Cyc-Y [Intoshia linei]|uniref:Cyc-Y n=1 Tax=Intoshia linei TaxID=1819745 RepID=A0A177AZG1_9BILA|nr:Cyc-Y [Intoshia linei]
MINNIITAYKQGSIGLEKLYEKKIVQLSNMHAELMDFNFSLHKKIKLINQNKQNSLISYGYMDVNVSCAIPRVDHCGKIYYVYEIKVNVNKDEWKVYRRYSDFYNFHHEMCTKNKIFHNLHLPNKEIFNKNSKVLKTRIHQLQNYLQRMLILSIVPPLKKESLLKFNILVMNKTDKIYCRSNNLCTSKISKWRKKHHNSNFLNQNCTESYATKEYLIDIWSNIHGKNKLNKNDFNALDYEAQVIEDNVKRKFLACQHIGDRHYGDIPIDPSLNICIETIFTQLYRNRIARNIKKQRSRSEGFNDLFKIKKKIKMITRTSSNIDLKLCKPQENGDVTHLDKDLVIDALSYAMIIHILCISNINDNVEQKLKIFNESGKLNNFNNMKEIKQFLYNIFNTSLLCTEIAVIALVYIERLVISSKIQISESNWRRILLGAIALASKVHDDQAVWNIDFVDIVKNIEVKQINTIEQIYLQYLHFNTDVAASVYSKYYFDMRSLFYVFQKNDQYIFEMFNVDKNFTCKDKDMSASKHMDEYKNVAIEYIDIRKDKDKDSSENIKANEDPTVYVSSTQPHRCPLKQHWLEDFQNDNIPKVCMCAYKLCIVNFDGFQRKIEYFILDFAIKNTLRLAHRQAWVWQDEYYRLKLEQLRDLEVQAAKLLSETTEPSKEWKKLEFYLNFKVLQRASKQTMKEILHLYSYVWTSEYFINEIIENPLIFIGSREKSYLRC